jgi:hypothetical protein
MINRIQVPNSAILEGPYVNWKHIDGPLMSWAGEIHWLTMKERFRAWVGLETIDQIACHRWPHLAKLGARLSRAALSHSDTQGK